MALGLFVRCSTLPNQGGTDTGNGRVTAMLYNPGGTPAANAKVCFYRHDNDPRPGHDSGVVDSVRTDANGNYSVTLPADTYTITASSDSGLAFQDSITAIRGDTVRPPRDTLRPAGSIKGVVRLEEGGDPTTVFILFMGTRTFTFPDDTTGTFTSDSMAAGTYRVRILTTTPNYRTLDTTLRVIAGTQNVLPGPLVLQYTGIPTPKNIRIVYDTMKQIVTLLWDSANASLVSSYNVYRRNVGLNTVLARINTSPVTGTSYRDSTGVQDSVYEYSVAAVNASASEGTKSVAMQVTVVSGFTLTDSIILNSLFTNNPASFAIDSGLKFYVPMGSGNADHVTVFNLTGDSIGVVKNDTSYNNIIEVHIARTGSIYVLDGDMIAIFNANGSVHNWFHILPSSTKMALYSQGDVYVTHYGSAIVRYDTSGKIIDSLSYAADDAGKMVIGSDGRIYDSHYYEIRVFDSILSTQLAPLNLRYDSIMPYLLQTVDSAGNLYVLYREDISDGIHRDEIFVYKTTGELVGRWGNFYFDNYSLGVRDIRISGRKVYILIDTKPTIRILSFSLPTNF
jgi:hypothetical protein